MTERYIELHAASAFSFLEGASQPEDLIERAVELEMPAMALLDRNGVYGSARFHTSAKRNNVRAHVGAEIAVSSFGPRLTPPAWLPHQHVARTSAPAFAVRIPGGLSESLPADHAVQNAGDATNAKARQPSTICSSTHLAWFVSPAATKAHWPLRWCAVERRQVAKTVERLMRIFGRDNVYVELQRHQEREEEWRNQAAIRIAGL